MKTLGPAISRGPHSTVAPTRGHSEATDEVQPLEDLATKAKGQGGRGGGGARLTSPKHAYVCAYAYVHAGICRYADMYVCMYRCVCMGT